MTCANILVGLGKDREGMETGDAGREGGDAAICVAPRRERRKAYLRTYCCILNFNPRSPRRERHREHQETRSAHQISIHAPAKGATRPMPQRTAARLFQSTLPRRERRCRTACNSGNCRYFNPRSREGSDGGASADVPRASSISIHAPAKGATVKRQINTAEIRISIHAPAKGATTRRAECYAAASISIHAPVKGATYPRHAGAYLPRISIHAPVKGAT